MSMSGFNSRYIIKSSIDLKSRSNLLGESFNI